MSLISNFIQRSVAKALGDSNTGSMFSFVSGSNATSPKRGTKGILEAYGQLPWFRAIVGKISQSTSTQQWKVFVEVKDGKAKHNHKLAGMLPVDRAKAIKKGLHNRTLEELEVHPILDVLNNGSSYLPGSTNLQVAQIHIDSVGDSFLLKQRNLLGVVEELLPLPPHWVIKSPTPGSDPVFKVSIGSIQQDIPATEIVWIKDPNPVNPYGRGSGLALSLIDELETDEYAAKHTKAWFYNSAKPDIIVSAEGLDKGATKRLEEDWLNKSQGFMKRFKPYFMNTKVSVQQLNSTFKDMQLIQLRQFERDMILQVFGVPPEIMGIIENSNRSTINSADTIFSKHVLVPRLELQRTVFQHSLVPDYDDRLILDYETPVKEDEDFRLEVMKAQPHAFLIDEWRELAGLDDLEDDKGKVYSVPFNLMVSNELVNDFSLPAPAEPDKAKHKALEPGQASEVQRIVNSINAQILVDAMLPNITEAIAAFGQDMSDSIGSEDFNINDPKVDEFLSSQSTNKIRNLTNETTRKQIRSAVVAGFEAGETTDDIAKRINRVFDNAQSNRSKVIARTETVSAANFGSQNSMSQARVPRKQWLSSRDSVVRDSHAIGSGLDGQVVVTNGLFKSPISGAMGLHPGALGLGSEDIQCRCTIVPVFDDEDIRSVKDFDERAKTAMWKVFEAQRVPFERRMRKDINIAFEKQRQDALTELNN